MTYIFTFYNVFSYFILFFRENYVFTCQCIKCEEQIDDPEVTSDDDDSEMEED